MKAILFAVLSAAALLGCSAGNGSTATLYRNSPFDASLRVHFASFDASESDPNYNIGNCRMVSRLMNANITASAKAEGKPRDESAGFWCEEGGFRDKGPNPYSFDEAFPTDT
ncbi:hypothetical protein [Sphingomonas oligophenolica]|uniref:hypothetical protein n=1 Tax=Sphingomonas oligophenolica TaxID=301154 RepID=UPI0011268694|nr:hypothetical protein [Sphingomonas oligophenolica]